MTSQYTTHWMTQRNIEVTSENSFGKEPVSFFLAVFLLENGSKSGYLTINWTSLSVKKIFPLFLYLDSSSANRTPLLKHHSKLMLLTKKKTYEQTLEDQQQQHKKTGY